MGKTLAQKILDSHIKDGSPVKGQEVGVKIDQTLTQDATGTMAYIEFESMNIDRVKTERSVAYIDHNTLQTGFENADDHRFISSVADKHGIYFSRPGNGICHQVHLERFSVPGKTLIGSDSHTPTCGGMGMLAIGAGGLDVAVAMAGGLYYITYPEIIGVNLSGKLNDWVSAKDIILEVLKILTVKGGVGKIIEYFGDGVKTLSVPERATITNMGAELGATTSIFPSDVNTLDFLRKQNRENDFTELKADEDAVYDRVININLSELEPNAACPHSPDNVKKISEIKGMRIDQVCIGSCTNSSLLDMLKVAYILDGKTVNKNVSLSIAPGSKQVLTMLSECGALEKLISSGARILESACGPCIGMGQSPNSEGISLRTFNRNFKGRSGTKDASVYLVSPETAALSAINGYLSDPREIGPQPDFKLPDKFIINDNMITLPSSEKESKSIKILRGPNIKEYPVCLKPQNSFICRVSLKTGDNISTDDIMPAGAKILPLRSNIPEISKHCFKAVDESFYQRALDYKNSFIIGGDNYGQGSSREHAALAPLYLGIKAVIAKSFARIHKSNLINAGILPLTFNNPDDYNLINQDDEICIKDLKELLEKGNANIISKGKEIPVNIDISSRQKSILLEGGLLNFTTKGE